MDNSKNRMDPVVVVAAAFVAAANPALANAVWAMVSFRDAVAFLAAAKALGRLKVALEMMAAARAAIVAELVARGDARARAEVTSAVAAGGEDLLEARDGQEGGTVRLPGGGRWVSARGVGIDIPTGTPEGWEGLLGEARADAAVAAVERAMARLATTAGRRARAGGRWWTLPRRFGVGDRTPAGVVTATAA